MHDHITLVELCDAAARRAGLAPCRPNAVSRTVSLPVEYGLALLDDVGPGDTFHTIQTKLTELYRNGVTLDPVQIVTADVLALHAVADELFTEFHIDGLGQWVAQWTERQSTAPHHSLRRSG